MDINSLTVGEAKALAKTLACLNGPEPYPVPVAMMGECTEAPCVGPLQVVAVEGRWIFVGNVTLVDGWCVITNAKNIRIWGTSGGLGELATNGPTSKTKIDNYGTVRVPLNSVLFRLDCEDKKWTA